MAPLAVALLALGVIAAPLGASAQSPNTILEGSNTAIEWRWSEGRLARFPDFAAELISLKVDLIVASTYPGTLAAKNATKTTPIIMVAVADPVRMGLIAPAWCGQVGTSRG